MPANNYIVAIERMMLVLDAFDGRRNVPLRNLVARAGLVKSSVFRILFTLQKLGCVEKTPEGGYSLTSRLRQLAGDPRESWDLGELANPFMKSLAHRFHETVNLGVLDNGEVSYVRVIESPQPLRLAAHAGMRGPLHTAALGKCLLSRLARADVEAILKQRPLRPFTEHTIRDRPTFHRELERVRARGYAIDNEEDSRGARCVAAPIFNAAGKVTAAISISGPAARIRPSRDREFAEAIMESCRQMSTLLGFKHETTAAAQIGGD